MNPPPFTFYFLFNKVFKVSVEKFYLTGYMSRDVTLCFTLTIYLIQRVSISAYIDKLNYKIKITSHND